MKRKILTIISIAMFLTAPAIAQQEDLIPFRNDITGDLAFLNSNQNVQTTGVQTFGVGGAIDLNRNGNAEVFFLNDNQRISLYEQGTGNTTISAVSGTQLGGIGDYEGDGDIDIVYQDTNNNLYYYDTDSNTGKFPGSQIRQISAPGGIAEITEDGQKDITYADDNGNLKWYDPAQTSAKDTGVDNVNRLGGIAEVNGNTIQVFIQGVNDLGYYNYDTGTTTNIGVNAQRLGGITQIDGSGGKDILFTDDTQNLKFYDIGTGGIADTNQQGIAGYNLVTTYSEPSLNISNNRTAYDNSISQGQPIQLQVNASTSATVNKALLQTNPQNNNFPGGYITHDTPGKITIDTTNTGLEGSSIDNAKISLPNNVYLAEDDVEVTDIGFDTDGDTKIDDSVTFDITQVRTRSELSEQGVDIRIDMGGSGSSAPSGSNVVIRLKGYSPTGDYNSGVEVNGISFNPPFETTDRIYSSPRYPLQNGQFNFNYNYSNSTIQRETKIDWRVKILENNPNREGQVLETISKEEGQFEIEKNPLELLPSDFTQQEASINGPIQLQVTPFVQNPTEFIYEDSQVRTELVSTAQPSTINIIDSQGTQIPLQYNTTTDEVIFDVSRIEPGQDKAYTIDYNIQDLQTTKKEETVQQGDQNNLQLNVTNPNPIEITNIDAALNYPKPLQTVTTELFRIVDTRTNIDENPDFAVTKLNTDTDVFTDRITWIIPEIEPGGNQTYQLESRIGNPISVNKTSVITNKPVRPVENINWRIGYRLTNTNPFPISYQKKVRVPAGADGFTLDEQFIETRFDARGEYILLDKTIPAFGETTTFLRYRTQSISSTVDINPPNEFIAGEPAEYSADIRVRNLADQQIENVTTRIDIGYGENIRVRDKQTDNVFETKEQATGDYYPELGEFEDDEVRRFELEYERPTAKIDNVRTGQTDKGNNLTVLSITTENQNPLEKLVHEEKNIECTNVVEVLAINRNTTLSYECSDDPVGATLIDLGEVQPNTEFTIGIEHRETNSRIVMDNRLQTSLFAVGKWLIVALSILFGYIIWDGKIRKPTAGRRN